MKKILLLLPLIALTSCTVLFGPEIPPPVVATPPPATPPAAQPTATAAEPPTVTTEPTPPPPVGTNDPLAGLVYRTPEGLWRIDPNGAHALLIDRPDVILISPETFIYAEGDDLWRFDAAGGQSTNLTSTPDRVETIWTGSTHPAGSVLFASYPVDFELGPGVTGFLTIVGLDGSGYRVLDAENQVWHFEVSPDGSRVAYGLGQLGLILDLTTGERSEFIPAERGLADAGSIGSPAWSPDGTQLSWVVAMQPVDGAQNVFGLAVFDLAAGTGELLYFHEIPGMDGYPPPAVWRPNGEWLVYNAFDLDTRVSGLWLLNPADQSGIYIGQGAAQVWRPDGGALVYLDPSSGAVKLYDPISLESSALEFSGKNVQPVAWLLP